MICIKLLLYGTILPGNLDNHSWSTIKTNHFYSRLLFSFSHYFQPCFTLYLEPSYSVKWETKKLYYQYKLANNYELNIVCILKKYLSEKTPNTE